MRSLVDTDGRQPFCRCERLLGAVVSIPALVLFACVSTDAAYGAEARNAVVLPTRAAVTVGEIAEYISGQTGRQCLADRRLQGEVLILTRERFESIQELSATLVLACGMEIRAVADMLFIAQRHYTRPERFEFSERRMKSLLEVLAWEPSTFAGFLPPMADGSKPTLYARVPVRELPIAVREALAKQLGDETMASADGVQFRPGVRVGIDPGGRYVDAGTATGTDMETGIVRTVPARRSLALTLVLW